MALPSGYTQLNYIQSSGNQYINTGFIPTANTRVTMDFQLTTAGTGNRSLFAVAGQFSFRWYGSGSVFRSNGNNNADFPTGIDGTARHRVNKTATTCTLDGAYSIKNTAGTVSNPLYLLAQNTGSGVSNYASAKLFACRIYENGSLVRDFIPAQRSSDSAVGLYDAANGVFYASAGSGAFTSGGVYDPSIPVGDHNMLSDGTIFAITGGQCMAGGTVYEIAEGTTLVNGTEYDIVLIKRPITLTVTGAGSTLTSGGVCYININGDNQQRYAGAGSTSWPITIEPGSYIYCVAKSNSPRMSSISLNGTVVASSDASGYSKYTYYPPNGANVTVDIRGNNDSADKTITITTS